jgi:acyl dehydratase
MDAIIHYSPRPDFNPYLSFLLINSGLVCASKQWVIARAVGRNQYKKMENIAVGQRSTRSITFTEEHVNTYADLSGDYNPLHFDKDFTGKTKFGKLVVQGGLTTGLLHALVAMDMPGPGTVFLSQNWKFTAPVFIGDTITAEAEVLSVHDSKPVTQLAILIKRQDDETVLEGEAWCYTFSP